ELTDDKRTFINAFGVIIRNAAREAIKQKEEGTLLTVLDVIEETHGFCAEKRVPGHNFIEFNETLQEILEQTIDSGLDEVARRGFWCVERIQMNHLANNVPAENEIWGLHVGSDTKKDIPVDHDKDLQWGYVSREYVGMLARLTERAIEHKRGELAATGLRSLTGIASDVVRGQLGNLQKRDIVASCYYGAEILTLRCADEGLYPRVLTLSPFSSFAIDEALERRADYSVIPLLRFSETLIQLASKDALIPFVLNELGTVGRGLVEKMDEDKIFVEALLFVTKVFDRIREILERGITEENKRVYLEVHTQIESLQRWMADKKKTNEKVEREISLALASFGKLEDLQKDYEGSIIRWPTVEG
ncbi:MAG: hypothetical protein H8E40_14945, partial [Chloroflexi bacterium]|nr:hypothetical protein [Chloroflexota bacterium]